MSRLRKCRVLPVALFASVACTDSSTEADLPVARYVGPDVPWDVVPFPRMREPQDNPSTVEKVELGRLLFYDPVLSRDHQVACATCHSELWGLSDGLATSVGVDGMGPTGPGRDGPNRTTRNSPTLWNVGFRDLLFWDGRTDLLEDQALLPVAEPTELGGNPNVEAEVAAFVGYQTRFASAFADDSQPISLANIGNALAAFERTLVSSRAPYDQYVAGDATALAPKQIEGMYAFADLGCATCHVPPLFQSDTFWPRRLGGDKGRFGVTEDERDVGAMRVPTLRNLRETAPYFHDGSVAELAQAIEAEVALEVHSGKAAEPSRESLDALTSFVEKGLMDRSQDPSRPKSLPSGLTVPADGFRIPR